MQETNMPKFNAIKSAQEIRIAAGKAAAATLPDEAAETLPVPRCIDGEYVIQILYYRERGNPGNRRVEPPDHCMRLDPWSGQVLRFWGCTPSEIGIEQGMLGIPGAGFPIGMTAQEFIAKEERLVTISTSVWRAFFDGRVPTDATTLDLVREYRRLFLETNKAEVANYTVAAAPDFFQWLEAASM